MPEEEDTHEIRVREVLDAIEVLPCRGDEPLSRGRRSRIVSIVEVPIAEKASDDDRVHLVIEMTESGPAVRVCEMRPGYGRFRRTDAWLRANGCAGVFIVVDSARLVELVERRRPRPRKRQSAPGRTPRDDIGTIGELERKFGVEKVIPPGLPDDDDGVIGIPD